MLTAYSPIKQAGHPDPGGRDAQQNHCITRAGFRQQSIGENHSFLWFVRKIKNYFGQNPILYFSQSHDNIQVQRGDTDDPVHPGFPIQAEPTDGSPPFLPITYISQEPQTRN